eukprot:1149310-Prymnesium_polylepis.1
MQRSDGESPLRVRSGEEGGVRVSFVKTSRLLEDLKAVAVSRAPRRCAPCKLYGLWEKTRMVRTKSTPCTGRTLQRRQLAIVKNPPSPMMRMPPFFRRIMREIDAAKKAFDAISTWECKDKELCANEHFGLVVRSFHMKPTRRFIKKNSEQTELQTTIIVELPADYPFAPPHITFMDKLDHPSIDLDGRYIGKALQLWCPGLFLVDYITSVQYELYLAL